MPQRDYETMPVSAELGLPGVIKDLIGDLNDLRAGKISVQDAVARSLLAKQVFNGVRIYLNGSNVLVSNARRLGDSKDGEA